MIKEDLKKIREELIKLDDKRKFKDILPKRSCYQEIYEVNKNKLNDTACCEYLTNVGLCSKEYLKRDVDASLSGGELKRIEIASLMARNPKLAIYDEPEAGIDLWSFSMLVDSFQKFKENKDQTVVIISHQEKIIDLADELMIIADGKVQNKGTKEEIMPMIQGGSTSCGCPIKEVVLTNER